MSESEPTGDQAPTGVEWVARFAAELGIEPPTEAEVTELLALAGTAAHSSERIAAPIACWLVGRAGISPADAHQRARALEAAG